MSMKLGPLQKLWVEALRKYPERQYRRRLGIVYPSGEIKACCLGQLMLCDMELNGVQPPVGEIKDGVFDKTLHKSFEKYGLRGDEGQLEESGSLWQRIKSLANMNDSGKSWPEIADYIEDNPEKVFTRSV